MARSFEILTESPAGVEQVLAAFSREDYWLARLAAFDSASTLEAFTVDDDGTVNVTIFQYLGRQVLPGVVAGLIPGDLKFVHGEVWRPLNDQRERRVQGRIDVSVPGGLGNGHADAWMVPDGPDGEGSKVRFAAEVHVRIPLLGRSFERSIAEELTKNIQEIQRFTTGWISEHACP